MNNHQWGQEHPDKTWGNSETKDTDAEWNIPPTTAFPPQGVTGPPPNGQFTSPSWSGNQTQPVDHPWAENQPPQQAPQPTPRTGAEDKRRSQFPRPLIERLMSEGQAGWGPHHSSDGETSSVFGSHQAPPHHPVDPNNDGGLSAAGTPPSGHEAIIGPHPTAPDPMNSSQAFTAGPPHPVGGSHAITAGGNKAVAGGAAKSGTASFLTSTKGLVGAAILSGGAVAGGGVAYNHYTTNEDTNEPTTYTHLFDDMTVGKDVIPGGDGVSFRLAGTKFNCYIAFSANMMDILSCFQSEKYDPERGTKSEPNSDQMFVYSHQEFKTDGSYTNNGGILHPGEKARFHGTTCGVFEDKKATCIVDNNRVDFTDQGYTITKRKGDGTGVVGSKCGDVKAQLSTYDDESIKAPVLVHQGDVDCSHALEAMQDYVDTTDLGNSSYKDETSTGPDSNGWTCKRNQMIYSDDDPTAVPGIASCKDSEGNIVYTPSPYYL